MTVEQNRQAENMDRRTFLRALAASATAATVLGGGAAVLVNRSKAAPVTTTVISAPTALPPVQAAIAATPAGAETSDLLARLAAAQAENLRLQSELAGALRRLEGLETANGDVNETNAALQTELASVNNRVSLLAGLVALYEQFEQLDLSTTVENGLDAVGEVIDGLIDGLPGLEAGIDAGRAALDELDEHLPSLQNGRIWLESHMARLATFYDAAEQVLEAALESAGSFLQKLNDWFQSILKWVPFGAGRKTAEVMNALVSLLDETPQTIHGLRSNIASPMDVWLQDEGGDVRLRARLMKPLREQALEPASQIAQRARQTRERFVQELADPVRTAAESRNLIREQIAAYRAKYEL